MSPPLSREDLALVTRIASDAAAKAVRDVAQKQQEEIDQLKKVDTRHDERLGSHSGTHKDIAASVRKTLSDAHEATIASVDVKLDAFRAEMRAELASLARTPEAADGAKKAALQAFTSAASASVDTEQIRSKQLAEAHDQRIRFWATIIPVIAAAVASIVKLFL